MADPAEKVALSTKLFYGIGSVAYGVKDNGFSYFLLLFYNQVVGLDPALATTAIAIALVIDAISDPVVGHWSDHIKTKWGRRHPFMYASIIPIAVTYYFLWNPPENATSTYLFFYLLFMAVLVRTSVTAFEIPSTALVAEFTDDYDERTSMLGFRYLFGWWGGLTVAVLAWVVFLGNGLSMEGFGDYGFTAAIIMAVAIAISAGGTHRHIPDLHAPSGEFDKTILENLRQVKETLSNRNFLALFVSALFAAAAAGLNSNLHNYFNLYFWELAPTEIARITLVYYFSAIGGMLIARHMSLRSDKKRVAFVMWMSAILLSPCKAPFVSTTSSYSLRHRRPHV